MTNTWLISDTHFGHKNILQYEAAYRKFDSIEQHDAEIVKRWNSVVRSEDIVYHLGDVAFNKNALNYLHYCKGKKILVAGNHDKFDTKLYLEFFSGVYGACSINNYILTHIPIHPDEMRWVGGNLHGHRHSNPQLKGKYFCVSCEQIDLTPINLNEIQLLMEGKE